MKIAFDFRKASYYSLCVLWASLTFSKALIEISFVFALGFWILWRIQEKRILEGQLPKTILIPFSIFILLSVFSHFWSEVPAASFRGVFKILQQVTIFYLVIDIFRENRDLRKFEHILFAVLLFTTISGLTQYFFGRDLLRGFAGQEASSGLRVSASFYSYGQLASFLITTIPFLVGLYLLHLRFNSLGKRLLYGLSGLSAFVVLGLTRSRGAFLAFFGGTVFFLILKRKFKVLLLLSLFTVGVLFVLPREMVIHLDGYYREQSIVERYHLWKRALSVIEEKPWTGTGINTYASAHEKYDKEKTDQVRGYYAHNGYLQMAAETGLPCLFFFLWFLVQYFRESYTRQKKLPPEDSYPATAMLLGCLNFLLFSLVDTVMHNPQPVTIFWFLLGVQWSYHRSHQRQELSGTR